MVKFAHLADCHLGSWRQEELQKLNFQSFQTALKNCLDERVEFILISGDLFDSAYPPIEILKDTFAEFRKVNDARIPVYIIAGSHDFSASGKTFLDVLEKSGFCKNVENYETQEDGTLILKPTTHDKIAIFGYSGKKSGMELQDLKKIKFDSVYPLTIFMLHTTIKDVVGTIPIESIEKEELPLADYYALGHIHQRFETTEKSSTFVYPGPIFPNNFQELVDLKSGSFQIVDIENGRTTTRNIKIPTKETAYLELEIENALDATEKIISAIDRLNLQDKIFLLKLRGTLKQGKSGDIKFNEIEDFVTKKGAYTFLRNISSLKNIESKVEFDTTDLDNMEKIEEKVMEEYSKNNFTEFNKYLPGLMSATAIEKNEDETTNTFENRLMDGLKKVLSLGEVL